MWHHMTVDLKRSLKYTIECPKGYNPLTKKYCCSYLVVESSLPESGSKIYIFWFSRNIQETTSGTTDTKSSLCVFMCTCSINLIY